MKMYSYKMKRVKQYHLVLSRLRDNTTHNITVSIYYHSQPVSNDKYLTLKLILLVLNLNSLIFQKIQNSI